MKKISLILTLLMLLTGALRSATPESKTYQGSITHIVMKGKPVQPKAETMQTFTWDGTSLSGVIRKMGKMPGSMHIHLAVKQMPDGTLTTTADTAGEAHLPLGIRTPLYITAFKGSVRNGELTYDLALRGKWGPMRVAVSYRFTGRQTE